MPRLTILPSSSETPPQGLQPPGQDQSKRSCNQKRKSGHRQIDLAVRDEHCDRAPRNAVRRDQRDRERGDRERQGDDDKNGREAAGRR